MKKERMIRKMLVAEKAHEDGKEKRKKKNIIKHAPLKKERTSTV